MTHSKTWYGYGWQELQESVLHVAHEHTHTCILHTLNANDLSHSTFQSYVSIDHVERKISPEELIRFTKPITMATAKAVAAGNSCRQDEAIVAANSGRKAICDLLRACKVMHLDVILSYLFVCLSICLSERVSKIYCSDRLDLFTQEVL